MANKTERDNFNAGTAKDLQEQRYSTGIYGPVTGKLTFILMDGLTQTEMAEAFADAILAEGPWVDNDNKFPEVTFADQRVVVAEIGQPSKYFKSIRLEVKLMGPLYYIYHSKGELGAEFPPL